MRTALLLAAGILLAASCWSGEAAATSATPDGAVKALITAVRANDVKSLVKIAMPPQAVMDMEKGWNQKRAEPMSPEEKAQFGSTLAMATNEKAEETLFLLVQPKLPEWQQGLVAVNMMIGMGLGQMLAKPEMSDAERAKGQEALTALTQFIGTLQLADEAKAKAAIKVLCTSARALKLNNADEFTALSFDQILDKAGVVVGAVKGVTAVYGLKIDEILDSVKVGAPQTQGDMSKVPVSFTFQGKVHETTATLKQFEGKWYGADALAKAQGQDEGAGEAPPAP